MSTAADHAEPTPAPAKRSRLWWWVIVAFLVQFTAWAVWLTIATRSNVQTVPLVTETGTP